MAIKSPDMTSVETASNGYKQSKHKRTTLGTGLLKGLGITFRHLVSPAVTVEYPDEIDGPAPRSRGVIALKIENCTVCMLCARECPDWCIYIEGHKEARAPKGEGKRAKKFNVLDRFAIDYALCMYCGICVEVCPYDALFWSPEFEYSDPQVVELTHEMDRLAEWMYTVKPPPDLEDGAEGPELKAAPAPPAGAVAGPEQQDKPMGPSVAATSDPSAMGGQAPTVTPSMAPGLGESAGPTTGRPDAAAPSGQKAEAAQAAPAAVPRPSEPPKPRYDPQTVHDAVLNEELGRGTDRKVAEARAKMAAARVQEEAYYMTPVSGKTTEAALKDEGAPASVPTASDEGREAAAEAVQSQQPPGAPEQQAGAQPAKEEATAAPEAQASPAASAEDAAAIRQKVLEEEMTKGSDPRVAEARAKAAEMRALKGTKGPK